MQYRVCRDVAVLRLYESPIRDFVTAVRKSPQIILERSLDDEIDMMRTAV